MAAQTSTPAAESGIPADQWRHVHFITPLLDTWRAIVAVLAFATYQNADVIRDLYTNADEVREAIGAENPTFLGVLPLWMYGLLVVVIVLGLIIGYTYLTWKRTTFAVGDDAVWFRSGLIMRQQRHARFDRIQAVDIVHPFLGRLFGLGKLKIEVAGGADSHVKIGYLSSAQLDDLRQRVGALAAGQRAAGDTQPSNAHGTHAGHSETEQAGQEQAASPSQLFEERPLYALPLGLQIHSLVRSADFIVPIFILLGFIAMMIVGFVVSGEWAFLGGILGFAPILLGAGGYMWTQINKNFNFSAFATSDGIRLKRGLMETRSQTIPPKRVHAVELCQPFLWRKPDWYKVRILQAGYAGEDQKENNDLLLPAGSAHDAQLALWLVIPDLGVEDPLGLIDAALRGNNTVTDPYFCGVPSRVRWIDWFSWKRRAFAVTKTALITRDGWLRRRTIIIPFERLQSLSVRQGPVERQLNVATVRMETVPGNIDTRVHHADAETALHLMPELVRLAAYRRRAEEPSTWNERISGELIPFDEPGEENPAPPAQSITDPALNTPAKYSPETNTELDQ